MNNNQNAYNPTPEEKAKNKRLKIIGSILIVVGIGCFLFGVIKLFSGFGKDFGMPEGFGLYIALAFVGLPMAAAGGVCLMRGSQAALIHRQSQIYMPLMRQVTGAGAEASKVAEDRVCVCGAKSPSDAKFCTVCAKPLSVACPVCGKENANKAEFCAYCAKKMK